MTTLETTLAAAATPNPLKNAAAFAHKKEPKLIAYALPAGCGTYVFQDGSEVSANNGLITDWKEEHERELETNCRLSRGWRRVFSEDDLRAAVSVAQSI